MGSVRKQVREASCLPAASPNVRPGNEELSSSTAYGDWRGEGSRPRQRRNMTAACQAQKYGKQEPSCPGERGFVFAKALPTPLSSL